MEELDVLSAELRSRSLSNREIVLEYDDALRAVDLLVEARFAILGWEGWAKYSEGGIGHHEHYQGAIMRERWEGESWETFVEDAASLCRLTMERDYRGWKGDPTPANATLFFCITAAGLW